MNYRIFESRIFIFDILSLTQSQVLTNVLPGENDLDVKFSPTEGGVIFTRQGNNMGAIPGVYSFQFGGSTQEKYLFSAASMPDWK